MHGDWSRPGDLPVGAKQVWLGGPPDGVGPDDVGAGGRAPLVLRKLDARTVRVLGGPREMLTVLEDFARGEGSAAAKPLAPGDCACWSGWRFDFDVSDGQGLTAYHQLLGGRRPEEVLAGLEPDTVRVALGAAGRGQELSVFTQGARTGGEDFRYTLLLGDVVLGIRGPVGEPERHVYDVTLMGVAHLLVQALRRVHERTAAHGDTAVLVFTGDEAEQLRQGARDWCAAIGDDGCPEWVRRVADAESAEEALSGLVTSTDGAARIAERLLELRAFLLELEAARARDWPGMAPWAGRQE